LVVDEAHGFCTRASSNVLLHFVPRYLLLLTATPRRRDELDIFLDTLAPFEVSRLTFKWHTLYRVSTSIHYETKSWNDYLSLVTQDNERNSLILRLVMSSNEKTLILTWRQDHVLLLYQRLVDLGLTVECLYGNKNHYRDAQVLIGTISKIGEGFDETLSDDFSGIRISRLILVTTLRSERLVEQLFGRVFRSCRPSIYVLVDDVYFCYHHWRYIENWSQTHRGIIKTYVERNTLPSNLESVLASSQV
jgi:superfamily II DNA or RNA helicase